MLKLYSYWRSSASYRVRIALNPQARVPLLVDGDFRLNQSQAILEYLEATHPQPALLHGDAPSWADCVLVPQLYAAQRFGCEVARYPRLARVGVHCATLPAFQRAHPDAQPDCGG